MKLKKYHGWKIFAVAIVICAVFLCRTSSDRYSVTYYQDDFRTRYVEEFDESSTEVVNYVNESDEAVKCFVKGPLSLKEGEYSFAIQYSATDASSVLKVYSSDYVSPDNSGGIIFINQNIDPEESSIVTTITLDQPCDSLFLIVKTDDAAFQIGRISMRSNNFIYNDTAFYVLLTMIIAFAVFYLFNSNIKGVKPTSLNGTACTSSQTVLAFVFIAAATVFMASLPLVGDRMLVGHDQQFHIARIEGIARGLSSGQFPVRVHGGTMNDYGYPNSLFYPELLLYIPAVLSLFGVSIFTAYKFYLVLINVLTLVCAYVAFVKLFKNRSVAMAISIVYLLSPYRLICEYYRAAIGEVTAITFLPLVMYGLYAILYGNKKDWFYLVGGATGVLQSHFLTTEITVIVAVIVVICAVKHLFTSEKRYVQLLYAAIASVFVNIWFLGPMLLMMPQLGLAVFDRTQSPAALATFNLQSIFYSATIFANGPHTVGWLTIISLALYLLYRIMCTKTNENAALCKLGDAMASYAVLLTLATTLFFPWEKVEAVPVLGRAISMIQFSYRLLSIAELCYAVLLGVTIILWVKTVKTRRIICFIAVCLAVLSASILYEFSICSPTSLYITNKSYYENNMDNLTSVGQGEYIVEGSDTDKMVANLPVIESTNSSFVVENLKRYGTKTSFVYSLDLSADSENMIILPISYIPNYEIKVDNVKVSPVKYDGGRVAFAAPSAQGNVAVAYKEPLIFRVFELISIISILCIIFRKRLFNFFKKQKPA